MYSHNHQNYKYLKFRSRGLKEILQENFKINLNWNDCKNY